MSSYLNLYASMQVSMEPTIDPGDKLIVEPATDARGEIVVFEPPAGYQATVQSTPFIKRVVGLAGDKVELKNGAVWVNGAKLDEPYVYKGQSTEALNGQTAWQIPDGHLFVLGDHRAASQDSRVFGPIAVSSVGGRVAYRCFPATSRGPLN